MACIRCCLVTGSRDSLPVCARTRSYSYAFPNCGTVSHPYFPSVHRGQRRYHVKIEIFRILKEAELILTAAHCRGLMHFSEGVRDNADDITTRYMLHELGLRWGRDFPTYPDRPRGPNTSTGSLFGR
jgi:hypothetical protein